MAEHIIETEERADGTVVYIESQMGISTDNPALLGEIVRCEDCVWGKAIDHVGCIRFADAMRPSAKNPNGYCAWGMRREDECQ